MTPLAKLIGVKLAEKYKTRRNVLKIIHTLPKAIQVRVKYDPIRRIPLDDATRIASLLAKNATINAKLIPVGSIRRKCAYTRDIDILVVVNRMRANILKNIKYEHCENDLEVKSTYQSGQRRLSMIIYDYKTNKHYKADLFLATKAELPFALYHHTGPAAYNIRVRAHAAKNGMLLNQYGLFDRETRLPVTRTIKTELDLANYLGVTYRDPTLR